jgi:PAS domain S-box-containing protein
MKQKETVLENLFRDFQTSFNQAAPEEKNNIAAQMRLWMGDLVDRTGIPGPDTHTDEETSEQSGLNAQSVFHPNNSLDSIQGDLKNLIDHDIHIRQITENIEQVFWLRDIRSGRILYVSPTFEKVWGYPKEQLYADPSILIESVHKEDRVQVMTANPINVHKPINQAYRIQKADGSLRWIFARTFLINNEAGASDILYCIAQDITDQKLVEQTLRKTLDRTREQFELSHRMSLARKPEAVLKTLMSAQELRSAQRAALLFFIDPKVGPSKGVELAAAWQSNQHLAPWGGEVSIFEEPAFWKMFQPNQTVIISTIQSDPPLPQSARDLLLEGQIKSLVIFPMFASGVWLGCLLLFYIHEQNFEPIELRHLKVLVSQATITLYNLQLLDVEEESRHEAERANEIKTEFLAMITHELRTPLTSIIGFTTTLLADDVAWEPDEQTDFYQTILREANRLQELIDHLLDLTRLEAGMLPIMQESHTLQEIVKDALPQLHSLTSAQSLTIELTDDLPPVFVDAKRISQVIVNLVRNSATYSPDGTEITISASVRDGFIQVNVNDHGPGIPTDEHKSVFKAFKRGQFAEYGSAQGAGLGLAICKGLIEAHGGRIWIKKKSTPGTIISFTIPLDTIHSAVVMAEERR